MHVLTMFSLFITICAYKCMRAPFRYTHVVIRNNLSVNLFLWRHELANSFLLLKLLRSFLKVMKYISRRHRLHFLLSLLYGRHVLRTLHLTTSLGLWDFRWSSTAPFRFFRWGAGRMSNGFYTVLWNLMRVRGCLHSCSEVNSIGYSEFD